MKSLENLKKYKEMKLSELNSEMVKKITELTHASLKVQAGKEDNNSVVKKLRKDIARIKTVSRKKQLGESNE